MPLKTPLKCVQLFIELNLRATVSLDICYYSTVLPDTWHKWTHPALTPARQAATRFTYSRGKGGWLSWLLTKIVYQVVTRPIHRTNHRTMLTWCFMFITWKPHNTHITPLVHQQQCNN